MEFSWLGTCSTLLFNFQVKFDYCNRIVLMDDAVVFFLAFCSGWSCGIVNTDEYETGFMVVRLPGNAGRIAQEDQDAFWAAACKSAVCCLRL